jgi:hypothetical protein
MTPEKQFLMLVQTGATLQDLTSRIAGRGNALASLDALDVIGLALDLFSGHEFDDDAPILPDNLVIAAREFLDWAYGLSAPPEWCAEWTAERAASKSA